MIPARGAGGSGSGRDVLQSQRLPPASAGSRFLIDPSPGVPLRSTPGFMLSCAPRTCWSVKYVITLLKGVRTPKIKLARAGLSDEVSTVHSVTIKLTKSQPVATAPGTEFIP